MKRIDGNLLRGHLETVVLAVLERREAHGFEIMQHLDSKSRGMLALKEGTLYPVLYRLENSGYISGEWDDETATRRGPRRRIYRMTKKGLKELEKRREAWSEFVSVVGSMVET